MFFAAMLALGTSVVPTITPQGLPAVLFRCRSNDGVTHYLTQPLSGANCTTIYYVYSAERVGITPSSILPECLDPKPSGSRALASPSARARECTRIRCAQASNVDAVRRYAMREQQGPQAQYTALTCIMRKEKDAASP